MLPWLLLLICAPHCEPAELSLQTFLEASPSHPVEGNSVTLTCKIQFHKQKPNLQLQFCFFNNVGALGSGCSSSPVLQIPTIRKEDSDFYWCKAKAENHIIIDPRVQATEINVQRIPVSDVSLETWPPGGWVMEGDKLLFICSVAKATGSITYIWYRGALGLNLETKIQHSLAAEFEIPKMKKSDAEQYYCAADNGYGPVLSGLVNVSVRVPVSRPVLTFGVSGTQGVLGDLVELHCEALRGSPPIFYQFYHENVILGNRSAFSGGGVSFNFSLTTDHSGNYSCEANNGRGAQRSEVVTFNLTVPAENRSSHRASGVTEWLLGCLGPITVVLIFCYWLKRKMGRQSDDPLRTDHLDNNWSPPRPVLQDSSYLNSPDPRQLQPVYENVNAVSGDDVYSLVYHTQREPGPAVAEYSETHGVSEVSSEIYSNPRKINFAYVEYEDTM